MRILVSLTCRFTTAKRVGGGGPHWIEDWMTLDKYICMKIKRQRLFYCNNIEKKYRERERDVAIPSHGSIAARNAVRFRPFSMHVACLTAKESAGWAARTAIERSRRGWKKARLEKEGLWSCATGGEGGETTSRSVVFICARQSRARQSLSWARKQSSSSRACVANRASDCECPSLFFFRMNPASSSIMFSVLRTL